MTMMAQAAQSMSPSSNPPQGAASCGRLVSTDGRTLPLTGTAIRTSARGGVARVVLTQRFENTYAEPLSVRYQVPLPADGAVSGFSFQLGDTRIVGEVDDKKKARARYESAIALGRSAALLEQDRSSLFTQEVGNIPPGEAIVAEIVIDQKLRWLPEGAWEWRFPTVVAPRFSGAAGRIRDAAKIAVDVADDELDVRAELSLEITDALEGDVTSPSHGVVSEMKAGATQVSLRAKDTRLDRDVVIHWPVAVVTSQASIATSSAAARDGSVRETYGLLTIVPPKPDAMGETVARDLILLIDTSGSMGGEPLAQARRVSLALIDSLDDDDQLEMIEFSWKPSRWKRKSVHATPKNKKSARKWLAALRASGGTQMREGILSALAPLRDDSQRQVVIISDGLIGFESEIVGEIAHRLPVGARVHTVGVGSAVNRSLTQPAARAGRGVEAIVGIGEDAERAATRLVAHTAQPVVVNLEVSGNALVSHAPRRLPDLLAGTPALVALELEPAGGELLVRGTTATGTWQQRVDVPPVHDRQERPGVVALFGRERVADLEVEHALGAVGAEGTPSASEQIRELGLRFQIATRYTSWVAVTEEATVDPTAPGRQETMPHELPYGMSAAQLGLRPPAMARSRMRMAMPAPSQAMAPPPMPPAAMAPPPPPGMAPPPGMGAPPAGPPASYGASEGAFDEMDADDEFGEAESVAPLKKKEKLGRGGASERARPKLRRRSLTESVVDGLRGFFGRGGIPGNVVILEDARMVISFSATKTTAWSPKKVQLFLADGTTVTVTIAAELTTRACVAQPGQVIRLALTWSGGALTSPPARIVVTTESSDLTITL